MNKKLFNIIFFITIFIITFSYSMFLTPSISDEIWSYSFCHNISSGLIPYRDFNMIITPLFSLIGSLFIQIFGHYIFSVHIFGALWVSTIITLLFKKIKWKSLICYIYILLYHTPTYNNLCLLWIFIILYLIESKKDKNIIIGLLISLCFLTKQTIGLCLFIPYIYYSKDKIKSIITFIIPIALCSIYLIYNNAFYNFIDYCFLGLFDFGNKNTIYDLLIPEILVIIYLSKNLLKSNFKDKQCFYILMFQIIVFPIMDVPHFLIAFPLTVYYFLKNCDIKQKKDLHYIIYFAVFGIAYLSFGLNLNFNIVKNNNFMYLRNADLKSMELKEQVSIIRKKDKYYDNKFYILDTACFLKLYTNEEINKFDILNNGNFGYKGSLGYIEDIDNICNKESCIFYIAYWYYYKVDGQLNKEILDYIVHNYQKKEEYKYFHIYTN